MMWAVSNSGKPKAVGRDGRNWPLGDGETAAWITRNTAVGVAITSAIPPMFDSYATITGLPSYSTPHGLPSPEQRLVHVLRQYGEASWWLGYLANGVDDTVFPGARTMTLYYGWKYVLVQAGPDQALEWRDSLPDLLFPTDRTWLHSTMWDDDWACLGGPGELVDQLASDPQIELRRVSTDDDVTPPGYSSA